MDAATHTPTPWDVSVLDKTSPGGEPCQDGAMIVTPPPMEAWRLVQARETFTSRRIALLKATHYTPHDVAVANAAFIVRACNAHDDLLAACKRQLAALDGPASDFAGMLAAHRALAAAVAKATA